MVIDQLPPAQPFNAKYVKKLISNELGELKDDLLNFSSFHAAKRLSGFFDGIVREAFRSIKSTDEFCLIAGGSYAGEELCPYSDIDIMILISDGLEQSEVEVKLKDFFYLFWDASVDLAQSVRTISEATALMRTDLNTYTSFINSRFIDGNPDIYKKFKDEFYEINSGSVFFVELMKNLRKRRLINVMTDNDIFLLEPDVKEGIGGLRDYSYCEWVYFMTKGRDEQPAGRDFISRLNTWNNNALKRLNDFEIDSLLEAKGFILKTRIMMHLLAGKKVDRLNFDLQEGIAGAFFYKDGKFLNKIEYFMHDYYKSAKNMHIISRLIINLLIKPAILTRLGTKKNIIVTGKTLKIDENLYNEDGLISVKSGDKFLSDPDNIFKLLDIYQSTGERLDMFAVNLLKNAAGIHAREIKNSATAKAYFINLLKKKKRVYQTLLLMHETNVLSALIPEFEKIDSLSTNDIYHVYTVDAHSLKGVNYLQDMVNLKINRELKFIFEDMDETDMLILNFSLLLHDIGKGYSANHEKIGSKIAVKVAKRLGMGEDERSCIGFLILNHFLMPLTSERRDIHDPATIKSIAAVAGSLDRLKLLFMISICDSMAVSRTRFNSWRKMLLVELFERTSSFIRKSDEYFKTDELYIKNLQEYVSGYINKRGYNFLKKFDGDLKLLESFLTEYISGFYSPRKYLVRENPENILLHLKLFSKISPRHNFNFLAKTHIGEDYYEIVICGADKETIFSDITGVLSYFDFNILSADINTRKDGKFIDTFFINHIYRKIDGNIDWHKLRNTFYNVFNGNISLEQMFRKKINKESLYKKTAPRVSSSVEIYNNLSDEFTVIEIQALDRKGLLYDIGRIFNKFGINIFSSKITTQGNKAYDTFYVKYENGEKIKSLLAIKRIKRNIVEEL